jgi:hypothetical protein
MSISQPPFQSTLVDANDRVQTPWAQWFSQLQPILQSVVASGPTSGRPTQNLYIGYPYFDTTIDQMVYWNGVIWVTYAPSTTGTSILKGNGSGGFNNAVAGIDFAPATSGNAILYGDGSGGFSSVSIGSGVTFAGGVLSATGSGGTVTAVTGTAPIASSGGNTPAISISQAGVSTNGYLSSTDWNTFNSKAPATSGTSILYGDGTGGFSNVTIGSGVTFVAGTLSATGSGGTVTAVTGSGNIASSGGTTPNITFTGTLPIANGGTNGTATPTAGAVAVGNGTQYAFTAAGSAGQVLTSNGSTVPTWATIATGIGTTGYWGSFWDTTNQTAASITSAYTINIGTSDPNNNGVSIVSSNRITVANAGVYNIQYSIQFQNIGTGNKNYNVDVWFRLNGVDIPDSNSIYWIASKNSTVNGEMIAAVNYVLSLNAGDYIQILWAVSDIDISIVTLPATSSPTVPQTPGVIVSVTPITEIGIGYYNLTSVSSVAIATGSKTFTTNLSNISTAFTVGTRVRVAYVITPANYMEGVITSFSGTTLVVNVDSIGGSGTYANWTISVAGIQGSNGVTSITGTANQVIASASTGAVTLSLPQSINSGATPTFTGTNFTGIPNAGLTNSSITINGTSTSLGGAISVGTVTGVTGTAPVVSSGGITPAISIPVATTLVSGYLSSTDWTTFNNKSNTNGTVTSVAAITLGTTGTDLSSTVATGATTPVITLQVPTASATNRGALSSTDWTTFNNKQPAGAYLTASTGVTTFAGNSTGLTPATATSGAITLAGILVGANGGTGLSSFTANGIVYASSSSALATGAALTYDGSSVINGSAGSGVNSYGFNVSSSLIGATNNYGFYGNIASSTGRWNLYMNGTAGNYIAGALGIGTTSLTARRLVVAGSMTGATVAYGALVSLTIQPDVTGSAIVTASQAATAANGGTPYTIATLTCFNAAQVAFNADSTVTSQYGFNVSSSLIGATNNYGFFGNIASAAGRWNLYMNGTAANYLAGNLLLGTTTQPTTSNNIVVAGLKATSAAAPTIASATTIAPTKAITFISGTTAIVTITAPNPISLGGGTITLIPTGIFTTTTAGNIALASTAVVGKALLMTYDVTTTKWYPSY